MRPCVSPPVPPPSSSTAPGRSRLSSRAMPRPTLAPLGSNAPMPRGFLSQWRKNSGASPGAAGRRDAEAGSGAWRSASGIGRVAGNDDVDEPVGRARLLHLAERGAEDLAGARIGHGDGEGLAIG